MTLRRPITKARIEVGLGAEFHAAYNVGHLLAVSWYFMLILVSANGDVYEVSTPHDTKDDCEQALTKWIEASVTLSLITCVVEK